MDNRDYVRNALGWAVPDLGPCLVIPLFDADGTTSVKNGLLTGRATAMANRSNMNRPLPLAGSSTARRCYRSRAQGSRPNAPDNRRGEKVRDGRPGRLPLHWSSGVDGGGKGGRLFDALRSVPWQGRSVLITFDSDAVSNHNVVGAEGRLAEMVQAESAGGVRIVRLPPGPAGPDGQPSKVGLDDFLVAHGADALRKLIAEAKAPAPLPESKRGQWPFDGNGPTPSLAPFLAAEVAAAYGTSTSALRIVNPPRSDDGEVICCLKTFTLDHRISPRKRLVRSTCDKYRCPYCGKRKCHMAYCHFGSKIDPLEHLYTIRRPRSEWDAIRKAMMRAASGRSCVNPKDGSVTTSVIADYDYVKFDIRGGDMVILSDVPSA